MIASAQIRDVMDCAVKIWSILYFSAAMDREEGAYGRRFLSMAAFIAFVLGQRYVLGQSLGEAIVRNLVLYALTCLVMLTWRRGQRRYLVFLASIVFFLWGGWLKLFSPMILASLHLPTFGYPVSGAFPLVPVTVCENLCRILCIVLMRRYTFEISPERTITAGEAFLALVPAVIDHTTVLILYYLTIVAPSTEVAGISFEMTLLTLMLVFGMPCILAATEKQFQLQRREMLLVRMENQMHEQVREFESRRLSDEQARRIYHDMGKHLSVLEGLKGEKAGQESAYLEQVRQMAEAVERHIHTGNSVLDTLLSQKERECREQGIELECMVDFSGAGFIQYADVVTLFANVVDNAMEAVRALPEGERRISLSAGTLGGQILVKCTNPFEGTLRQRGDGLFATSKEDKALHGIGLGNVRRIVEKYGGVLEAGAGDGQFQVMWMIPVPVEA